MARQLRGQINVRLDPDDLDWLGIQTLANVVSAGGLENAEKGGTQ